MTCKFCCDIVRPKHRGMENGPPTTKQTKHFCLFDNLDTLDLDILEKT